MPRRPPWGRASSQAQAAARFVERRGGDFFGGGRRKSAGTARPSPRVPGLGSMQHDIDANRIKRKDDQAGFRLLQNAGV